MTRRHLDKELGLIKDGLLKMAGMAEEMMRLTMKAYSERSGRAVETVLGMDGALDEMEVKLDQTCIDLLALQSPLASDLRFVTSAIKILPEVERIGDHCEGIARRALLFNYMQPVLPAGLLDNLGAEASSMVLRSVAAFVANDADLAREVIDDDDKVDDLYDHCYRELLRQMVSDPLCIERASNLIMVIKNWERIADRATNIAEEVLYIIEGVSAKHKRTNRSQTRRPRLATLVPHVLLLEGDSEARNGMEQQLRREGFGVSSFGKAAAALEYLDGSARGDAPQLAAAILCVAPPNPDGAEVLKAIRARPVLRFMPVLLITPGGGDAGLKLAEGDSLSGPIPGVELAAKVRSIMRRAPSPPEKTGGEDRSEARGAAGVPEAPNSAGGAPTTNKLTFGPISVDLEGYVARVHGSLIDLTKKEFDLLAYLMQNPRRAQTRDRILSKVWGLDFLGESRTIDSHIRRLRIKLGAAGELIETIVGVGYRLGSAE